MAEDAQHEKGGKQYEGIDHTAIILYEIVVEGLGKLKVLVSRD